MLDFIGNIADSWGPKLEFAKWMLRFRNTVHGTYLPEEQDPVRKDYEKTMAIIAIVSLVVIALVLFTIIKRIK